MKKKKTLIVASALIAGCAFASPGGDKDAKQSQYGEEQSEQMQSEQMQSEQMQSEQTGTGGSGEQAQEGTGGSGDKQKRSASVAGDVIAVEETTVYVLDKSGVAIPIAVTEELTLFDGKPMKQGEQLSSKVRKGDKVSAQVEKSEGKSGKPENRATSIDKQQK